MNRVTLIGKVSTAPRGGEANGTLYSNFNLATHESYVNKRGVIINKTLWHRIVVFGNTADFCNINLTKGTKVQVEGRINYRDYIDNNGLHLTAIEIVAYMVRIISNEPDSRRIMKTQYQTNEHSAKQPQAQDTI